mgnify:CR=1 FL=1
MNPENWTAVWHLFTVGLPTPILLRLDPRLLSSPVHTTTDASRVPAVSGLDFTALIARLKLDDDERFNFITQALREVVPSFERIGIATVNNATTSDPNDFDSSSVNAGPSYVLNFDFANAKGVAASAAGDGTLLTLGILASLATVKGPRLLLLDEIERGLHPRALGQLVKQLRGLQVADPTLQIVATSHSPYLVDHFSAEEVILTDTAPDGSRAAPLSSHPDWAQWKDEMAPGEFWTSVGEDWIKQLPPAVPK